MWTAENDSNTLRVDAKIFISAKKYCGKKKFQDTCGHGPRSYLLVCNWKNNHATRLEWMLATLVARAFITAGPSVNALFRIYDNNKLKILVLNRRRHLTFCERRWNSITVVENCASGCRGRPAICRLCCTSCKHRGMVGFSPLLSSVFSAVASIKP